MNDVLTAIAHLTEEGMTTEHWVVLSNILLIVVTAATAILMAREQHKHAERTAATASDEKADLVELVHQVIEAEHEEEMKRLDLQQPGDPAAVPDDTK